MITNLEDIKKDLNLVNAIDWDMTPEDAVTLYLEWGNNWARSNYVIRSADDVAHYFVVNTWKEAPMVYLVRRNSEKAEELAGFRMPESVEAAFLESIGHNKGVYAIEGLVREWLEGELIESAFK